MEGQSSKALHFFVFEIRVFPTVWEGQKETQKHLLRCIMFGRAYLAVHFLFLPIFGVTGAPHGVAGRGLMGQACGDDAGPRSNHEVVSVSGLVAVTIVSHCPVLAEQAGVVWPGRGQVGVSVGGSRPGSMWH